MNWSSFFLGVVSGYLGLGVAVVVAWRYAKTWFMSKLASFALDRAMSSMVGPQNEDFALFDGDTTQ